MISQNYFLLWMLVAFLLSLWIVNFKQFDFLCDGPEWKKRNNSIDGLRCFMALLVLFHHSIFEYNFVFFGQWKMIDGFPVVRIFGSLGVSIFFMISGYLFAGLIYKNTTWSYFFVKRAFRIAPMCLFSSIVCVSIALLLGDHIYSGWELITKITPWLDGGVVNHRPDVSSFEGARYINSGVTWTLTWEWGLYISLPIIHIVAKQCKIKKIGTKIFFVVLALLILSKCLPIFDLMDLTLLFSFSVGFASKESKTNPFKKKYTADILIIIIFVFLLTSSNTVYSKNIFACAIAFYAITRGTDLFGLLRLKSICKIGEISYSIYIIHGITFFLMNHIALAFKVNHMWYMVLLTICYLSTIIISALTYKYIERPLIIYSKNIINKRQLPSATI